MSTYQIYHDDESEIQDNESDIDWTYWMSELFCSLLSHLNVILNIHSNKTREWCYDYKNSVLSINIVIVLDKMAAMSVIIIICRYNINCTGLCLPSFSF